MAVYNNGFPMSYQQFYPTNYQMQSNNTQPQSNGIIWVQGEAGAKSYLVAPNNTVQLWDSESQTIYLKSADASGMPSMRILDYTIRDTTPQISNNTLRIDPTNKRIEELSSRIEALEHKFISMEGNSNEQSTLQSNEQR